MRNANTANRLSTSRPLVALLAAAAIAVALLLAMAGPAHAQANCTTISGYQVCSEPDTTAPTADVLGVNESRSQGGTLPVTGNDPSKYVVAGAAFVIMGGAALVGSRRSRQNTGR